MTRRSRSKGLPPKVQLRTKDSLAAAYPTGHGYVAAFDDTRTVVFTSYVSMSMGAGLPSGSQYLTDELTTDMYAPGVLRKGVGDAWIDPLIETFTPFRDSEQPAVDGKSSGDIFYATGSAVGLIGEGFDQPLWSKTKLEIDLTPSLVHSYSIQNNTGTSARNNFPTLYWNNELKKYEGIGNGIEWVTYTTASQVALSRFLEEQCIGFGTSYVQALSIPPNLPLNKTFGQNISNFGFPFHPKFHATASNLISMSDVITGPFLVEKILLTISAAFHVGASHTKKLFNDISILNFFVLNQRRPFSITNPSLQTIDYNIVGPTSFVTGAFIPGSNPSTATVRDLITTLKIGLIFSQSTTAFQQAYDELQVDAKILIDTPLPLTFSGRVDVSGAVRNNLPSNGFNTVLNINGVGGGFLMLNKQINASRNGLNMPSGRGWLGDLSTPQVLRSITQNGFVFQILQNYYKTNPYIILPSDQLIFGCQIPYASTLSFETVPASASFVGEGTVMEFAAKESKLYIFGSYIKENKESDKQPEPLTSLAVHEVIG